MVLKDYIDSNKLQALQSSYAEVTGLDAVVFGLDGERLAGKKGFQEEETDSFDIIVNGDKLGSVVIAKSSDKKMRTAAELLSTQISQTATLELLHTINSGRFDSIKNDIKKSGELVQMINEKTGHLKGIAKKQTILSLNATIEAARSGEAGVGFAVVAKSMQDLSGQSAGIYTDIETSVEEITNLINSIIEAFK
ncbi:methyl-accepting chemotaxis protein McpB [Lachnospiraceae bacterium]|nr:methyl-accepting chemotaxis protein McpB [Lachnospiraceae bacterium]GFI22787.1 methyl-accepting chemotaxis protein McpB [Lachnospiraceae bacterium]